MSVAQSARLKGEKRETLYDIMFANPYSGFDRKRPQKSNNHLFQALIGAILARYDLAIIKQLLNFISTSLGHISQTKTQLMITAK